MSGHPFLISDLKGKAFSFLPLSVLAVNLPYIILLLLWIQLNFETIFIPGNIPTWPQCIMLFIHGYIQFANILKILFHEGFFFFVISFPTMFLSHLGTFPLCSRFPQNKWGMIHFISQCKWMLAYQLSAACPFSLLPRGPVWHTAILYSSTAAFLFSNNIIRYFL